MISVRNWHGRFITGPRPWDSEHLCEDTRVINKYHFKPKYGLIRLHDIWNIRADPHDEICLSENPRFWKSYDNRTKFYLMLYELKHF